MSIPSSAQNILIPFISDPDNSELYDFTYNILTLVSPFNVGEMFMVLQKDYDDGYIVPIGASEGMVISGLAQAITLDPLDVYSLSVLNYCLKSFVGINDINSPDIISAYTARVLEIGLRTFTGTTLDQVRADFFNSELIITDQPTRILFAKYVAARVAEARRYFTDVAYSNIADMNWEVIDANLEVIRSEIDQEVIEITDPPELDQTGIGNLQLFISYSMYPLIEEANGIDTIVNDQLLTSFITRESGGNYDRVNLEAFYRVFSTVNPSLFKIEPWSLTDLMNKMSAYGVFNLITYAGEISDFAKKRLRSVDTVQQSAAAFVTDSIDLPWLMKLDEVSKIIRKDQVFFGSLVYYFPSLVTFLLDAIAVTGDYSNGGSGGSTADEVNDPSAMVDSLEKAFGMGADGQQVFELAFKLTNTAKRIKDVILRAPFRPNTPPENPDIFHLRLGASNFYVPPVSIDVNSSFKAGSLMAGALRQKNSPKFNSGYRETTIRMRLFFPNYEEIWGISIDDASNIRLTEDFKIKFIGDYNNDGIIDGDTDRKIDKFLSSLRGLVAAFKYSPFLPIKNHYLNSVHGITAVGLVGMNISTIPNFPFALSVDLEMVNFNYKPLLPMITDFNQAIHWGKYRQYMGRAAGQLNRYINEEFLLKSSDVKEDDNSGIEIISDPSINSAPSPGTVVINSAGEYRPYEALEPNEAYTIPIESQPDTLKMNIINDWTNGNHLTIFAPAESQTKLFLPSISSFRTEEEKLMTDLGRATWESLLFDIGIDLNESASYGLTLSETLDISRENAFSKSTKKIILDAIDILTSGVNSPTYADSVYQYLVNNFIIENKKYFDDTKDEDVTKKNWLKNKTDSSRPYPTVLSYIFQGKYISEVSLNSIKDGFIDISTSPENFLEYLVDKKIADQQYRNGAENTPDRDKVKEEVKIAFNVALYERFFQSGPIQSLMEAARARAGAYQFNEWEVPMLRVDLDPESVIINGVTVNMGNNLVKLQVQMQDEPTYQHIGGRDSHINISMTVIGEKELIKLKSIFDHISGLARLEHASGVIGFLGIKNIITALSGIKYVMPLNYSVSTRPNFPHVYDVQLSLVDFDIFQQKREEISSRQQTEIIDHFNSKRNPFLRIKQLWGAFNAYPDFPLEVKDQNGETVGCLDPDFYFRSFEMFDNDVINHVEHQRKRVEDFSFDLPDTVEPQNALAILGDVLRIMRSYSENISLNTTAGADARIELLSELTDLIEYYNVSKQYFISVILNAIKRGITNVSMDQSNEFLLDFISFGEGAAENNPYEFNEVQPAPYQVGSTSAGDVSLLSTIEAALEGRYSLDSDKDSEGNIIVSFHPDEVDFHKQIFAIPASDADDIKENKIPSILMTAIGTHYGYVDKITGRFYLTAGGQTVSKTYDSADSAAKYGFSTNFVDDTQTPDRGTTNSMTGAYGVVPLSEYQKPYSGNSAGAHWEKMLVDTRYRDLSGRMIRVFPTYMLWLIDEGGYFAGVKLFDNFYGLQSIIDFSVVSSEDLLGDTLIFRVSNLYSKLTKKESTSLFSTGQDDYVPDALSLPEGLGGIIDRTLNTARNILSGMRNEYVVDIQNIRLKPGVRVHLRAGYGANPNSLQTIFNGVITNVEQGEIVTVTAQSDAIELGTVVNSTNKKGDSGKIDGGIDTGMYLSEPRDLMVRLLSMGSSRTREAIAHATRGTVFSENKFGIRHFGNVLYEPLNPGEKAKNDAIRDQVTAAYQLIGGDKSQGIFGFSMNVRGGALSAMGQLWANFSAQIDLEIFKRNIYPGNGLGIAQFLGGDIDDGWSTVASLTTDEQYFDRQDGYLGRLTDLTYNKVLADYQMNDTSAKETVEQLTARNALIQSGREGLVTGGIGMLIGGIASVALPVTGAAIAGASLLGVLSGRGGVNVFRTMGIISPNSDDDLSGFDEVSFRAQTYMRTVWDLFQTCARLLPNYIVAVRPFEDRSTVFYGKPHWLYTSGVIPVTTGFPGEEKARELRITSGPKPLEPDQLLQQILDTINKDSNPLSDYSAYFQAYEPSQSFATVAQQISTSTGIYAPSTILTGKVINFYSSKAQEYRLPSRGNEIVSKLPTSFGYVGIGPHLPIIPQEAISGKNATGETSTEGLMTIQKNLHKQINNLPPRYSFPYFTVTEKLQLELSGSIAISPTYYEYTGYDDWRSISYNSLDKLAKLEGDFFNETKFSIMPSLGGQSNGGTISLDTPIDFSKLIQDTEAVVNIEDLYVKMPLPSIFQIENNIPYEVAVSGDYSFEYGESNYGELTYKEWGAPQTPEDEQFYIAMRWPYNVAPNVIGAKELDDSTLESFKNTYGFDKLYGAVEDYKSRKVLVYNPSNGRAVVCRPAYFLWGEGDLSAEIDTRSVTGQEISARVSPDAAYFLGIITFNEEEARSLLDDGAFADSTIRILDIDDVANFGQAQNAPYHLNLNTLFTIASSGYRFAPRAQQCYFSFIPDSIPVGVLSSTQTPISQFKKVDSSGAIVDNEEDYIVGFGTFSSSGDELMVEKYYYDGTGLQNPDPNAVLSEYKLYNTEYIDVTDALMYGGNPVNLDGTTGYFNAVIEAKYDLLTAEKLNEFKKSDLNSDSGSASRQKFLKVWDPIDITSIQARQYFDENYDPNVSVIAGNGRTLDEASQIWDQFRAEYHTYDSVKRIFADVYGLNPDGELPFPEIFKNILAGTDENNFNGIQKFKKSDDPNALDEFAILLGSDYLSIGDSPGAGTNVNASIEAIEFMRENWIDQPLDDGGLIEFYNHNLKTTFARIGKAFFDDQSIGFLNFFFESESDTAANTISIQRRLLDNIQTPKQLFLLMVGIFRQRMWEDPYARAWLVLKPDKKPGWFGASGWSLKPVDQIFRAFIDPYQDYAKPSKKAKFLQLLVATRGEGNNSSTHFAEAIEDVTEFVGRTVGPIFSAIGDALSGLMSMFKLSMQQLGYALSEVGNFKRQANILNKALNDSIYYSLGRPGTLLRAVDNPFTREYGEPVIEIREPFQRLHYISSFSHILSNQIQENLNGVSTVITAVSDGKYPVSVALDKGAPAERQVEKTVETGIIFDNITGSGFTGFLHPFMHPMETFRGIAKNAQGTPDELSARRVALAHLKESIKDIYGGELIILGNTDIRPHDLVYLSDVYERMYGIFEVEQVVHHFTPELGFITSITPNALVTVNDPARWFMTSWMQSWMHVQNIRNDSRIYIDNIRNANAGLSLGGNISVDRLSEILSTQLVGGFQFTHGSTALVKDIMASEASKGMPGANQAMLAAEANKGDGIGGVPTFAMMASAIPFIGPLVWKGWKWVRDNVLDQHGCYVQYLNKNGQPMDAGLSYNQGMVVGQHHSTALLPGILGVRAKTRTPEGNSYIRTDDLFKSLGWNETEISEITRHISYESSLVHARVLKLSGLGPEKAGFDWQFRTLCKVTNVRDGDTIDVQDIISGANFAIRFDGIGAAETNSMDATLDYPTPQSPTTLSILDISTPGGIAKMYVKNAIENKIIVARINQTRTSSQVSDDTRMLEEQFEAGSSWNNIQNYQLDIFGRSSDGTIDQGNSSPRALGTIFYKGTPGAESSARIYVSNLFRQNISNLDNIKANFKAEFYDKSPFSMKFNEIYDGVSSIVGDEYYTITDPSDDLFNISNEQKLVFSRLVYIKILEDVYDVASRWPRIEWDEYYPDGTPVTLNWELVVNNLARIFVKDLQKESQSVQTSEIGLGIVGG